MKLKGITLIAALSFAATSGLMAKPQAKDEVPGVAAQPASYFYTGKPYDADLGAYTFQYRNYDPELKRWTSSDPSGFPDWANNHIYGNTPTSVFDPNGLEAVEYKGAKGSAYAHRINLDPKDYLDPERNTFSNYNLTHPNSKLSGECATGVQYTNGTWVKQADGTSKLHDMPKTATWVKGDTISKAHVGLAIAYGWVGDGYDSKQSGNHTVVLLAVDKDTITVMDQYNVDVEVEGGEDSYPTGMQIRKLPRYGKDWHVVTTPTDYDPKPTDSEKSQDFTKRFNSIIE